MSLNFSEGYPSILGVWDEMYGDGAIRPLYNNFLIR